MFEFLLLQAKSLSCNWLWKESIEILGFRKTSDFFFNVDDWNMARSWVIRMDVAALTWGHPVSSPIFFFLYVLLCILSIKKKSCWTTVSLHFDTFPGINFPSSFCFQTDLLITSVFWALRRAARWAWLREVHRVESVNTQEQRSCWQRGAQCLFIPLD